MVEELSDAYGQDKEKIKIETVGAKPGEKMYEELMSHEETRRAWELGEYFVVFPAFQSSCSTVDYTYPEVVSDSVTNPYHSGREKPLTHEELSCFLRSNGLIGSR